MALNTTPNLHLPQWTPNEKPAYLTDFNQAFASIDTGFAGVKESADSAASDATDAMAEAASALQTANQAQSALNAFQSGFTPSIITLATSPAEGQLSALSAKLVYNNAVAVLSVSFTTATSPNKNNPMGTITLPANIHIAGGEGLTETLNLVVNNFVARASLSNNNNVLTLNLSEAAPGWGTGFSVVLPASVSEGGSALSRTRQIEPQVTIYIP